MTDKDGGDAFLDIMMSQEAGFDFFDPDAVNLDVEVIAEQEIGFSELEEGDQIVLRREVDGGVLETTLFVLGRQEVSNPNIVPQSVTEYPLVLNPDRGFAGMVLLGTGDSEDEPVSDLRHTIEAGKPLRTAFGCSENGGYCPVVQHYKAPSIDGITDVMLLRKRPPLVEN